jgi:hypothetical protein
VPDEGTGPTTAELPLPGLGSAGLPGSGLGPGSTPAADRHTAERDGTTG